MACEALFKCRSVTHGSLLVEASHARLTPSTIFKIDPGPAGSPGPVDAVITYREVMVEMFGRDFAELAACVGTTEDCVIGVEGAAGAAETLTASSVTMSEYVNSIEIPENDAGGKIGEVGVRGYVNFAAGEGFGDVITPA